MASPPAAPPASPSGVSSVRHIVAVASGKGGVGKSTVSANLAVALAARGLRVGLMDADIYGPSVPLMFGVPSDEKPRVNEDKQVVPLVRYGVSLLSMGFLVDDRNAVIWRGPMVSSAIRQFLGQAAWGELDVLVLDLPPGTGDIQLTIVQTVPLAGAVVVTTPQPVAVADARKAVAMFGQVGVPILGLVENMAWFSPPDAPERRYHLFGEGGGRRLAAEINVPVLAEVPLEQAAREAGDAGLPVVLREPDGLAAQAFVALAGRVMEELARRADEPQTPPVEILYR